LAWIKCVPQDCLEPGLLLMKWVFPVKKIYLVKGNVFVRKKYDRHETIGEIVIPVRFWRGRTALPAPNLYVAYLLHRI